MNDESEDEPGVSGRSTRRTLLKLGALAAPAVITLKPAMAQSQASMLLCQIPVTTYVKPDGMPTSDTSAVPPPPNGFYYGEDLIRFHSSGSPMGVSPEQFEAHMLYIKNHIGPGDPGFTCLASLLQKI